MSAAHEQKHPYHLVDPSPWPGVGAIAAFVLTVGTVLYMHEIMGTGLKGAWLMILGLVMLLATVFLWWRDVVKEAEHQGHHTPIVQLGLRYGMSLFIASEVMFFVAFFWAFFDASLYPASPEGRIEVLGGVWPPEGVLTFAPFDLPFLNTIILLTSGATVTWAHHAILEGNRKHIVQGLGLTIILGIAFTCVQAYEYIHAPFNFDEGIYPSTFFMATGFHGFHVIVGTTFLIVCFFRAVKGHFKPDHHFGFEAAAWYWHFVDVVWLFLFCAIYWWGAGEVAVH